MFLALSQMKQMQDNEAVFKSYLQLAMAKLKLSTLNEMIQENRDNAKIFEPLLKCILVLENKIQGVDEHSCCDLINLLRGKIKSLETE